MSDITIYVDGTVWKGRARYAFIVIQNSKVIHYAHGDVPASFAQNSVSGELVATIEGLKYAKSLGINDVTLCYDYIGIERFATGKFRAQQPIARWYVEEFRKLGINVTFVKVSKKSDPANLAVDALAKKDIMGMKFYIEYKNYLFAW